MKKILLIFTLFVSLVGFTQDTTNFVISGNILNTSDSCLYVIYDVSDDLTWRMRDIVKIDSSYSITVNPDETYLITFLTNYNVNDPNYDEKHVYLTLNHSADKSLDIDFSSNDHTVIYYDLEKKGYYSYSVPDVEVQEMYKD